MKREVKKRRKIKNNTTPNSAMIITINKSENKQRIAKDVRM